jgi:pyrroloquinoline quinone (PQQ) biosynthesis protein C
MNIISHISNKPELGLDGISRCDDLETVREETEQVARRAFAGDRGEAEKLHRAAYKAFVANYHAPWMSHSCDAGDPPIATFLWTFAHEWDKVNRERHAPTLRGVPTTASLYQGWITDLVHEHASNVGHPLFNFLAQRASREQLREFFRQETPFDLYFADILISLAPGIYGRPKLEIAQNFWDEMGGGDPSRVHRTMRLRMMALLELPESSHEQSIDGFMLEEIELANAYFIGAQLRSYAAHLIGILLATESMVPGRLQKQIDGWRRVGLGDSDMIYLLEHTTVDVEHADDWMSEVVGPIIDDHPNVAREITLGVLWRLDIAGEICDKMMPHLQAMSA